jgi:hypothetical protein
MTYYLQEPVDQKSLENLKDIFIFIAEDADIEKKQD